MDPAPAVYAALDALGISYERHEHPAVFTAADASQFWDPIPGVQCKNLFLRNKKGDRHYLVVVEIGKRVDLKDLVRTVADDRLSFGSAERLMAELGLTPGSVSPFGLINDAEASCFVVQRCVVRQTLAPSDIVRCIDDAIVVVIAGHVREKTAQRDVRI